MHIPDNFLATPVWAALDGVSLPAITLISRRAAASTQHGRAPLLGVLGAFVFAAQMINFPVGVGTSGHLIGGALLACTVGPGAATVIMTAILAVQAFIFQDGGVLALGANTFNMAIAGVWIGYLPFRLWGNGRHRSFALFSGGFLSVLVSALLALSELLLSGVRMPRPVLLLSLGLFAVSAVLEGAITVAVLAAIERLNPGWVQAPEASGRKTVLLIGGVALILAVFGFFIASSDPDGLERLGMQLALVSQHTLQAPLADYSVPITAAAWFRKAAAGLAGFASIFVLCLLAGRWLGRPKDA